MGRSGYSDDYDSNWDLIRWRGAITSAIKGKRGQQFFRDLVEALDAMSAKRLISDDLMHQGDVCALGALAVKRGHADALLIDPEDHCALSQAFDIAEALVREVEYVNDDAVGYWVEETPENRWDRVRRWAQSQIIEEKPNA